MKINYILTVLFFGLLTNSCVNSKITSTLNSGNVVEKSYSVNIPYQIKNGLIIIEAELKGNKYNFLLDTGAPTVISRDLFNKLGLKIQGKQNVSDFNSNISTLDFALIENITIAGIHFQNIGTSVYDLEGNHFKCLNIEGIIGANLMKNTIWDFNFPKNTITIKDKEYYNQLDMKNMYKTKFFIGYDKTPSIISKVDGNKVLNTIVDLGYNGGVNISNKVYEKLNPIHSIQAKGMHNVGIYEEEINETINLARIDEFSIGNMNLKNQTITFNDLSGNVIGLDFFKNTHLILNWFDKEMLIDKSLNLDRTKNIKSFGYTLNFKDNYLYISAIYNNSEASKKGLQVGDKIVMIDGVNYENMLPKDWCDFMTNNKIEDVTEEIVILRNGVKKTYKLRKEILL